MAAAGASGGAATAMGPTGLIGPVRLIAAVALPGPTEPSAPIGLPRLSGPIAAAVLPRSTGPALSTATSTVSGPITSSPPSGQAAAGARAAVIGPSAGEGPRRMPVLGLPLRPGRRIAGPAVSPTPTR